MVLCDRREWATGLHGSGQGERRSKRKRGLIVSFGCGRGVAAAHVEGQSLPGAHEPVGDSPERRELPLAAARKKGVQQSLVRLLRDARQQHVGAALQGEEGRHEDSGSKRSRRCDRERADMLA